MGMDPTYSAEAAPYREKIQAFLAEHLPANWKGIGALDHDAARAQRESAPDELPACAFHDRDRGFHAVSTGPGSGPSTPCHRKSGPGSAGDSEAFQRW